MTDEKTSENLLDKSLRLSGLSFLLGDAAMMISGILIAHSDGLQKKNSSPYLKATSGLLWSLGGVTTSLFGNPKVEKQVEILSYRLEEYLARHGANISDATREKAGLVKHDIFHLAERFCYEHPSEIFNALSAAGALTLGAAGFIEGKEGLPKKAMAALVIAGALGGLLIKEDKDAMKKAEHGNAVDKAVAWVREKPLRVSSILFGANNLFAFKDAFKDMHEYRHNSFPGGAKPYWFSFLSASAYGLANAMLFLSPRNQIQEKKFDAKEIEALKHVAAEIIGAQPKELQAALLKDASDFMAKEKSIPMTAEKLAAQMHGEVQAVKARRCAEVSERSWRAREQTARHMAEKEMTR